MGGSFVIDGFGSCQCFLVVHASPHATFDFNDVHTQLCMDTRWSIQNALP